MTSAQNKRNGPLFRLGMSFIGLNSLDLFGNIRTDTGSSGTEVEVILNDKFENFSQFCGPCVVSNENENVNNPQKEFLLWH